jgi:hypothetical protein
VVGIAPRVHDAPNDAEQIEGAARQAVDGHHRHRIAGGEALEEFELCAPVTLSR